MKMLKQNQNYETKYSVSILNRSEKFALKIVSKSKFL